MHTYLQNSTLCAINTYNFISQLKRRCQSSPVGTWAVHWLVKRWLLCLGSRINKYQTRMNLAYRHFQDLAANDIHLIVLKCQTSALELIDQYSWIWWTLDCSKWSSVHDKTQVEGKTRLPTALNALENPSLSKGLGTDTEDLLKKQTVFSNRIKLLIRTILLWSGENIPWSFIYFFYKILPFLVQKIYNKFKQFYRSTYFSFIKGETCCN